ncbi:MAG: hypothetical protein ABI690_11575 [Chloroflexota bacterium]
MQFLRRPTSTNALVGIFLLVLLAVFAGPGMLPRIISSIIPSADESIPCDWLRTGQDRAEHQSLIGRSVTNPISLHVRTSPLPSTAAETLVINIVITNESIGTVAIHYNPTQVRLGDDGVGGGLGIVFNAPGTVSAGQNQGDTYPESDIRLLGPRQSCVHRLEFLAPFPDASISTGNATVRAYYRNTTRGASTPSSSLATPIYADQGLWVGVVESDPVTIPFASG